MKALCARESMGDAADEPAGATARGARTSEAARVHAVDEAHGRDVHLHQHQAALDALLIGPLAPRPRLRPALSNPSRICTVLRRVCLGPVPCRCVGIRSGVRACVLRAGRGGGGGGGRGAGRRQGGRRAGRVVLGARPRAGGLVALPVQRGAVPASARCRSVRLLLCTESHEQCKRS